MPLRRIGLLLGGGEPVDRGRRIAAPQLDHARQRDEPGEERAFLVAELAALRRKLRSALELTPMSGDQRERDRSSGHAVDPY